MHRQEALRLIGAAFCCALLCCACGDVQQTKPDDYIYAVLTDLPAPEAAHTQQTGTPEQDTASTESTAPHTEATLPPTTSAEEKTEEAETETEKSETETETEKTETETETEVTTTVETEPTSAAVPSDIVLVETENGHYSFMYDGQEFEAIHKKERWKIKDSWRITDSQAMTAICQALINEYPIPSADREGWRTAEDMVYEWTQHNLAYALLPDDSEWKSNARDVDFDPDDQGRSMYEIYKDRTEE